MPATAAASSIDFWFEFASSYSYVAASVIDARAAAAGVAVRWRPFLLGPIFARQGWRDSPFNINPVKGRYMWRDVERRCAALGVPFARPTRFPQHTLLAARVATVAGDEGWGPAFGLAAFRANFAEGCDLGERATVAALIAALGRDPHAVLARAEGEDVKARLRDETARAEALGVFGAPTFTVGDELFWGGDRIDDALDRARGL
jgi:2-hydroxychromene-2-carboxylate isomerase